MDIPPERARPWWAVPLIAFAVGLAIATVAVLHVQSYDEPWLSGGAQLLVALLIAVTYSMGCLFLLTPGRRRWPLYGASLAVVGLVVGIWLHHAASAGGPTCQLDSGFDLNASCAGRLDLEARVADWLIPGSLIALLTCWLTSAPAWLAEVGPRLRMGPRFATVIALPVAGVIAVGAVMGWRGYQHQHAHDRLVRAERALAAMALPPPLAPVSKGAECPTAGPDTRCASAPLAPEQLASALTDLVDVPHPRRICDSAKLHRPCELHVTGRIAGYPAFIFASSRLHRLKAGEPVPPGAVRCCRGFRDYWSGSEVTIMLLTPEE